MSKIGEFTIINILDELIGGIEPIGETTYDAKAEYNLKKWAYVATVMVERIEDVANINCDGEYSMEKVKNIAKKELKEIADSIADWM